MAGVSREAKALIELAAKKNAPKVAHTYDGYVDFCSKTLNWEPRNDNSKYGSFQRHMLESKKRFAVYVLHRRAGKTVGLIPKMLAAAYFNPLPSPNYAYLAPTKEQVKTIAWKYFVRFSEGLPNAVLRESSREVRFTTEIGETATITLYGVDNPKQRLRGGYLDGVIADEFSLIPEHVRTEQVRPMLSDLSRAGKDRFGYYNQWMVAIGTPKGKNHFYRLHRDATAWAEGRGVAVTDPKTGERVVQYRDDWDAMLLPASETGLVAKQELQAARAELGHWTFDQEFGCSFDASAVGSIFGAAVETLKNQNRIIQVSPNPSLPVNTAWDLGWNDPSAVIYFQHVGGDILIFDYEETKETNIPGLVGMLRARADNGRRFRYGYHLMPHDVAITELGTGKSRKELFRSAGMLVSTVPKTSIQEQIACADNLLRHRVYFGTPGSDDLIERLKQYHRRKSPSGDTFIETPHHDENSHGASALMTLALGLKLGYGEDTFGLGGSSSPSRSDEVPL